MPSAEWVNLPAACEKMVAVDCAALVRPVRASVRWRMVASVAAVASAPPATELAGALSSFGGSIAPQFEFEQFEDFAGGIAVRSARNIGRRRRQHYRLWSNRRRSRFRLTLAKQTERHGPLSGICDGGSHARIRTLKSWLTIASYEGSRHYLYTEKTGKF